MAEGSTSLPPPYTAHDASRSVSRSRGVTNAGSHANHKEVRAAILDNAPILWIFGHGRVQKPVPERFVVTTIKAPDSADALWTPGHVRACLMFVDRVTKERTEPMMFVPGPPEETTEEAMESLLSKTQEMIGRRWKRGPVYARMMAQASVLEE